MRYSATFTHLLGEKILVVKLSAFCKPTVFAGSMFGRAPSIVEEERKVEQTDGEDTLACWPPKASLHKNPRSHTGKISGC